MIDNYSYVAQQPVTATQAPIDTNAWLGLGQLAEKKKSDVLDAVDAALPYKAVPGSIHEANLNAANKKIHDLAYEASATPDLANGMVGRDFIRRYHKIADDPTLKIGDDNYKTWMETKKNRNEQANSGKYHPDNWWSLDAEHKAYQQTGNMSLTNEDGTPNDLLTHNLSGPTAKASVDVEGEVKKLMDLHANKNDQIGQFLNQYTRTGYSGITRGENDARAQQILGELSSGDAGQQLYNRYQRLTHGQGNPGEMDSLYGLPNAKTHKREQLTNFNDYVVNFAATQGRQQVYSDIDQADKVTQMNAAADKQVRENLQPTFSTSRAPVDSPYKSGTEGYNKERARVTQNELDAVAAYNYAKEPSQNTDQKTLDDLLKNVSTTHTESLNLQKTYDATSARAGGFADKLDEEFKKLGQIGITAHGMTIPDGQINVGKTTYKDINEAGSKALKGNSDIMSGVDDQGKDITKGKAMADALNGSIKILDTSATGDLSNTTSGPTMRVEVTYPPKTGGLTSGKTTAVLTLKGVPSDLIMGIAGRHSLEAARYGANPQTKDDLVQAEAHAQQAEKLTNSAIVEYVDNKLKNISSKQAVSCNTADLGGIYADIPVQRNERTDGKSFDVTDDAGTTHQLTRLQLIEVIKAKLSK